MQNDIVKQPKTAEPAKPEAESSQEQPVVSNPSALDAVKPALDTKKPAGETENDDEISPDTSPPASKKQEKKVDPTSGQQKQPKKAGSGILPIVVMSVAVCLVLVGLAVYSQLQ